MDATYPMVGINCGSSTAADCGSTNGGSTTSNDSEDGTVTGKLLVFSRFYIGAAVVQGRECWKCITNPAITTASLDTSDLEEVSVTQLTDAFLQAFSAHSAQDYHLIGWYALTERLLQVLDLLTRYRGVRCFLKARDDDNWRAHGADDRVYVVFDKCTENTEGQGDGIGGL